jgi:hypothetical protein
MMPRHEQIRCRYAHCNDDVPAGWAVHPLDGWHGAKGYVLWSKEGNLWNDVVLVSDQDTKDFMITVLTDAEMAGEDLRLWASRFKVREYVCVAYPNVPLDLCEATADLIFKQPKP